MDFYKSRKSNSTSSNHSHSNSSQKSHSSNVSNGGAAYNLEYCTSSSSLSPFDVKSAVGAPTSSCPSSSAKTVVNAVFDELILSSASRFNLPLSQRYSSTSSSPVVATGIGSYANVCSSRNIAKRKRRSSQCLGEQDHEIGFEPPLAKRQQTSSTLYQSDVGSVVSSVYPSPVEIDTQSSTESRSNVLGYDSNVLPHHDDIPDTPKSSPQLDDEHNHDVTDEADEYSDDEEIVSNSTSPSVCSAINCKDAQFYVPQRPHNNNNNNNSSYNNNISNSSSNSKINNKAQQDPLITTTTTTAITATLPPHYGECTLGQRYTEIHTFDDFVNSTAAHYVDCMTPAAEPEPIRQCPLPALSWANAHDVWQLMCKKDEEAACLRDPGMLEQHPGLQPRMRAILLDWLIEVCEVYKLHRETYYLAVDYLDRYLSVQKKVLKTHLQLIGITCLFVAAKVEEIYPPKIGEFAYVTDGACQEADILQHEILLLQALEWSISPVTPMGWLGVYMQLNVNNRTPASLNNAAKAAADARQKQKATTKTATTNTGSAVAVDDAFIYPQFSGLEFVQTAQLLDLCSLDLGIASFPYSVIAAAAISHTFNREIALRCSGLDWETIAPCALWMEAFFHVICEESNHLHLMEQNEQTNSKCGLGHICPNIVTDDSHIIQTHTITMTMFERACLLQDHYQTLAAKITHNASPATGLKCPDSLLTPPGSIRKPLSNVDEVDETVLAAALLNSNRENIAKINVTAQPILEVTSKQKT